MTKGEMPSLGHAAGLGSGGRMEYKQFTIRAFEREPSKWRAKVQRTDGKPLVAAGRTKQHFITSADATTADAALLTAFAAIDAAFLGKRRPIEKFWRIESRAG